MTAENTAKTMSLKEAQLLVAEMNELVRKHNASLVPAKKEKLVLRMGATAALLRECGRDFRTGEDGEYELVLTDEERAENKRVANERLYGARLHVARTELARMQSEYLRNTTYAIQKLQEELNEISTEGFDHLFSYVWGQPLPTDQVKLMANIKAQAKYVELLEGMAPAN